MINVNKKHYYTVCKSCNRQLLNDKNRKRLLKHKICSDCVEKTRMERAIKNFFRLKRTELLKSKGVI